MAFDPASDDPELLRTVVQLIRLAALSANSRQDAGEINTAHEKLTEAPVCWSRSTRSAESPV